MSRARSTRALFWDTAYSPREVHGAWCLVRSSVEHPESPQIEWWTRLQPIRTAAEVLVEFVVFTREPLGWQRIADEARRMAKLGMSGRAIGRALGVDEKTVRKVLGR